MIKVRRKLGIACVVCSLALVQTAAARALTDAASELATKILALLKPGQAATFSLENTSTLDASDVAAVRAQLEAANLRPAEAPADAGVRVTLAENFRDYVWVAEIPGGPEKQVALVAWPRPEGTPETEPALRFTLESERVWEQEAPILDWTFVHDRSALLILERERLALYRRDGANWALTTAVPVPAAKIRDPRGRIALVAGTGGFTVYLPAGVCTGLAEASLTLDCRTSPALWPLEAGGRQLAAAEYTNGRNFFDGRVSMEPSERRLSPFFSFAALQQTADPVWVFAGVDGQARLYTPQLESLGTIADWGSDITSVATACGDGWQALATRPGDGTEADAVRAYQIAGRKPVPVSTPLALPGPVTALWPAADGKSTHAVVRELKTDRYAALHLDVTCAQ